MNKFLSTCLFFIAIVSSAFGQSSKLNDEVGYLVDHDNIAIDGFLDFTYNPKNKTTHTLAIGKDYTYGHYYDRQEEKRVGMIKYSQSKNYINFKSEGGEEKKITPDQCIAYVIGLDSFIVIHHFLVEKLMGTFEHKNTEFAEVIKTINGVTFYEYTNVKGQKKDITYFARRGNNGPLVHFPIDPITFKTTALEYFGQVEYLKGAIERGTLKSDDILQIIKYLDYYNKFQRKGKIYYTDSWEETQNVNTSAYYAIISGVYGNKFLMDYYQKDGLLIYKGQYSSLVPLKKTGKFSWYYSNGALRKIAFYDNNQIIDSIIDYYPNGNLHYVYKQKKGHGQKYIEIYDISGKQVLNKNGAGEETFYDSTMMRSITRVYNDFEMTSSFYLSQDGKKVYLSCDKNARCLLRSESKLSDFKYPKSSFLNYNHGMVLMSFLSDNEGNTTDIKIIKGIDEEIDKMLLAYCRERYSGKVWSPAKMGKENVSQEIIMPYLFELKGFSRYKNVYFYNNLWQQQLMMQQMMMMNHY